MHDEEIFVLIIGPPDDPIFAYLVRSWYFGFLGCRL